MGLPHPLTPPLWGAGMRANLGIREESRPQLETAYGEAFLSLVSIEQSRQGSERPDAEAEAKAGSAREDARPSLPHRLAVRL